MARLLPVLFGVLAAAALWAVPPAGPTPALAYDCDAGDTGTLQVDIIDDDTGLLVPIAGSIVQFNPDTQDGIGIDNVTDNGSEDNSATIGRIVQNNTCSTQVSEVYVVTLLTLPDPLDDCDIIDADDGGAVPQDVTTVFEIHIDCEGVPLPTPTAQPAAQLSLQAAFPSIGCNSFNFITATVKDADGNPKAGAVVQLAASFGTLEATQLTTGSNGQAGTFYRSPVSGGGTVTITAAVTGTSLTATTTFLVNCAGATATTAPPPTVAPATGLSGPSTGDGGVAARSGDGLVYAALLGLAALAGAGIALRRSA